MRDQDDCPAPEGISCILHKTPFAFGIKHCRRLVQNEDGRILDQRASERQALALASGQLHAFVANYRIITIG